ncbi:MAG: hypothetical protein LBM66_06920 [Bifidobacteriaceae bacterium]|jgi:alpha,alpha-trehalose phosphorylase|nr:hypothetical protein [Bifidobacteriaceae bacterium]
MPASPPAPAPPNGVTLGRARDLTRFPVDPWALRELNYSPSDLGRTETIFAVGNGYLGMRANPEEGRTARAHGTFINGFHETFRIHHAEEAYGFATVGQTIVNVPDTMVIRAYVDDEPLLLDVADLEAYERTLDFRAGQLVREVVWRTQAGKQVHIRSTRMVSFPERHLALMTYELTMLDDEAPIAIASQILNRQDGADEYDDTAAPDGWVAAARGEAGLDDAGGPTGTMHDPRRSGAFQGRVLQPEVQRNGGSRSTLGYRCTHSKMTLAVAMDHEITAPPDIAINEDHLIRDDGAEHVYKFFAPKGVTFRINKYVSYHTSRGVPAAELADRCDRTLDRAMKIGAVELQSAQRRWLDDYWDRCDVIVHGQPERQQAVRWCLYQLAQATARAEGNGIPAKGVTGPGYSGHYFWDSEIYVLPFCTYTSPRFARNDLRFRHTMLGAARRRAAELSSDGALYPWRTINGEEASAYYAAGTAQYHIDADIAYALIQYVAATGDVKFLENEGLDILVETARMWYDLGFWRSSDTERFHIHGVTGPDEYTTVVNDNLYTNVMAKFNMRAAADAVAQTARDNPTAYQRAVARLGLHEGEAAEWRHAAEEMHIPYDFQLGIHPQDDQFLEKEVWDLASTPADHLPLLLHYHPLVIYRFQVLKQADVVLAEFLRGGDFSFQDKVADFDYYDPLTTGDSSLSATTQAIMAAECGYQELALKYFDTGLFIDLEDLHMNAEEGLHVASAGGVWSALVFGFGGMRDYDGQISFDPRLPDTWEALTFRVTLRGTRIRCELDHETMSFTVEDGEAADFTVRGAPVHVEAGQPVTVDLETEDEPRLIGTPTLRDFAGSRRADGTVIQTVTPAMPSETRLGAEAEAIEAAEAEALRPNPA